MANLSNINNKFIVTDGGNALINATANLTTYGGLTIDNISNPSIAMKTSSASGWIYTQYITSSGTNNFSMGVNQSVPYWGVGAGAGMGGSNMDLVVNSSGNVGIGTFSPSQKLVVQADWNGSLSNNQQLQIQGNTDTTLQLRLGYDTTNDYAEIAAIKSGTGYKNLILNRGGANVGIGTNSPQERLHVVGLDGSVPLSSYYGSLVVDNNGEAAMSIIGNSYSSIYFGDAATNFAGGVIYEHSSNSINFRTNGNSEKMRIDSSGDVTIGSSTLTGSRSLTLLSATNATTYDINFQQAGTTNFGRIRFTEGASDFQFIPQVGQGPNLTLQYGGNSFFSRGNVGIGTDSPGATLDVVNGGNYESIRIGNSQLANVNKQGGITALNYIGNPTSIFQYATNAGANAVYYGSADGSFRGLTQHSFMVSAGSDSVSHSQMLRINAASINAYLDQYIIKTTPTIILEGRNSGNSGAKLQFLGWANTHDNWELGNAMAGQGFQFRASATAGSTNFATVAVINSNTGVYTATSDINKKKDFEDSKIGLNEVMKLKPKLFRMKTENENLDKHLGFIAQEVKEVIPQAYLEENGKDNTKFIGIQDRPIIAALTKAIQELKAEIELLKSK